MAAARDPRLCRCRHADLSRPRSGMSSLACGDIAGDTRACDWRHAVVSRSTCGDVAIDRRGCGRWYPRMSPPIRVRVVVDTREVAGEMRACDRRYPRMSPPIYRHVGVDRRGSRRRHASVWPSTCGNVGRGMPRVAGDMAACHREHGRVPCVRRGPVQRCFRQTRSGPCGPDRSCLRAAWFRPVLACGGQAACPWSLGSALRCGRRRNRLERAACNPSRPWFSPKSRIAV